MAVCVRMKRLMYPILTSLVFSGGIFPSMAQQTFETDTFKTSAGNLAVTFIGHGSLMLSFNGKVIHVDPFGKTADYSKLPKADLILVTHQHQDHLDTAAMHLISTAETATVLTRACADKFNNGTIMANGGSKTLLGVAIEAVPAYNIVNKRDGGQPFHPRGEGNGYVLTFGKTRVYIAGDTENTPEMMAMKNIDVAFLPMNLPYTMTPEMVADAAHAFKPKVLYPYHYGETDVAKLVALLKDEKQVEVRIRNLK